ncbi:MAG: class I SAM-dependent methyltransferase [Bacteroidia bacterium]|nr:class I SAM-dependent methyltransferase [Bacteroidia bacterium]NND51959.1 methyltransferase domain-containing protein [Flavobacteriaceae bacterium]
MNFYQNTLKKIVSGNIVSLDDNILVIAGGEKDRDTFFNCGFKNVTITNLDYHGGVKDYEPFAWQKEDAENLSFDNNTFDWVFVHAGLHHCASPHKGLCEMLRVSRKGVGVFESRDSLFNTLANKFNLAPSYELEPVALSDGKYGGMRNSHIPNYVYKWTENEVRKTVNSFMPQYIHRFHFFYGLLVPTKRLAMSKNVLKRVVGYLGKFLIPIFTFFFKKQGNLFAFVIEKNQSLQPWLKIENNEIVYNLEYSNRKFEPEKFT